MADCSCKICREGHSETTNALPDKGMSRDEIQAWIKENLGFTISKSTLKQHFDLHNIKVSQSTKIEVLEPEIDLREQIDECDASYWLSNPNPDGLLDKLYAIHAHIHFLLAVRAKTQLERHLRGELKHPPGSMIKDLDISFSTLQKVIEARQNADKQKQRNDLRLHGLADLSHSDEDIKRLEVARLEQYLTTIAPELSEGDLSAIDKAVKIGERKAKLLGLEPVFEAKVNERSEQQTRSELELFFTGIANDPSISDETRLRLFTIAANMQINESEISN
ncbi:hypothetical protein C7B61_00280 [filamentous cyanobacterium CCP1]|nr:hypothetical protein C7B76_16780 [filamentous cyanobacterium CCP2]PSB68535.1 hypothetical protein C7B61_00280 [filamentous cyanobacterium CCP1]